MKKVLTVLAVAVVLLWCGSLMAADTVTFSANAPTPQGRFYSITATIDTLSSSGTANSAAIDMDSSPFAAPVMFSHSWFDSTGNTWAYTYEKLLPVWVFIDGLDVIANGETDSLHIYPEVSSDASTWSAVDNYEATNDNTLFTADGGRLYFLRNADARYHRWRWLNRTANADTALTGNFQYRLDQ